MTKIVLITHPGKDLDDEQALILLAGLHKRGIVELRAVVANLDPAEERARLAKGTLNCLGLPDVPVGIGADCFKGGENLKCETDASYSDRVSRLHTGHNLLLDVLNHSDDKSITLILNSGLTDAAKLFMDAPQLFCEKVKGVAIMGGVRGFQGDVVWVAGPDGVRYLVPDDAANNAFDWPAALFLYQALQEHKIPMTVFMRWAPYAAQFPFSLYDQFAATGNPIGTNLFNRQKPFTNQLWAAAHAPEGSPVRGKLPISRDRKWFVNVFCNGKDPGIGGDEDVWPFVDVYNQYDPLNVIAAVPDLRDRFYDPIAVEVRFVTHLVIGIDQSRNGIKDCEALRVYVSEMEISALKV